jgi:hypothetical protein
MNKLLEDFLSWLKVHKSAREYILQHNGNEYDHGYIKACLVIEYELNRLIKEHKDELDLHRTEGN